MRFPKRCERCGGLHRCSWHPLASRWACDDCYERLTNQVTQQMMNDDLIKVHL